MLPDNLFSNIWTVQCPAQKKWNAAENWQAKNAHLIFIGTDNLISFAHDIFFCVSGRWRLFCTICEISRNISKLFYSYLIGISLHMHWKKTAFYHFPSMFFGRENLCYAVFSFSFRHHFGGVHTFVCTSFFFRSLALIIFLSLKFSK